MPRLSLHTFSLLLFLLFHCRSLSAYFLSLIFSFIVPRSSIPHLSSLSPSIHPSIILILSIHPLLYSSTFLTSTILLIIFPTSTSFTFFLFLPLLFLLLSFLLFHLHLIHIPSSFPSLLPSSSFISPRPFPIISRSLNKTLSYRGRKRQGKGLAAKNSPNTVQWCPHSLPLPQPSLSLIPV